MLSKVVEPMALEFDGTEVSSSEEALSLIDEIMKKSMSGTLDEENVLDCPLTGMNNTNSQQVGHTKYNPASTLPHIIQLPLSDGSHTINELSP